jgi:uncharacterized membrane protein
MKITLKTIVLVALLAFFVIVILSNFSNFEGFTSSDENVFSPISSASEVTHAEPTKSAAPTKKSE